MVKENVRSALCTHGRLARERRARAEVDVVICGLVYFKVWYEYKIQNCPTQNDRLGYDNLPILRRDKVTKMLSLNPLSQFPF